MFKVFSLISAAVANIHNINEKVQTAYKIWNMVYSLFAQKAAEGQPTPDLASVQKVINEAEAEAAAAVDAATSGIKL